MKPYWEDGQVQLYLGDCRQVIPALALTADLVVADPPYAETSLAWDRWPDRWLQTAATVTSSLWCFGSMRMFLDRRDEFNGWKLSQDIVWEKHNGSGFQADRFKRVHEAVTHWYRGDWQSIHHDAPRRPFEGVERSGRVKRRERPAHMGEISGPGNYELRDSRLIRSVMQVRSTHGIAIHPTQKPVGILTPLIEYACPPGGLVIDPFAGSGSSLEAARLTGRRAIGIERHEPYIEAAALRLSQAPLELA